MRVKRSGIERGPRSIIALLAVLASAPTWSQTPKINWDLDEAIRQIERQGNDFSTAMSRVEIVNSAADGDEADRNFPVYPRGFVTER